MDIDTAAKKYHNKSISEAIIEPSPNGNGWRIIFHNDNGEMISMTDHSGAEKRYHTLDNATNVVQTAGFKSIRVEEKF